MFGFHLRVCLNPAAQHKLVASRLQKVHQLASLEKISALPPKKAHSLLYPFSELDAYLDRSVDRTQFQLFHPSVEDMARAEKLFHSSPTHKIDYYTSAERMDHVPALKAPEVCFIGRSNVGKSSLIKSLFSLTPEVEVRVSKTPGHTKKMNFFRVGGAFTIVDVPGYGHRAPKDFGEMVEPYLNTRTNLVRTFLLVDGSVGLQKADLIALEMCEDIRRPYVVGHLYVHAISRPRTTDERETEPGPLSPGWLASSSSSLKYVADALLSSTSVFLLLASPSSPQPLILSTLN